MFDNCVEFHKHAKVMTRSLGASQTREVKLKPAIKASSIEQYQKKRLIKEHAKPRFLF